MEDKYAVGWKGSPMPGVKLHTRGSVSSVLSMNIPGHLGPSTPQLHQAMLTSHWAMPQPLKSRYSNPIPSLVFAKLLALSWCTVSDIVQDIQYIYIYYIH